MLPVPAQRPGGGLGRSKLAPETLYNLEDNLLLFFTGYTRSASEILREQDAGASGTTAEMIDNLHFVKEIGTRDARSPGGGRPARFAELMNVHWEHKKRRSPAMSNDRDRRLVRARAWRTARWAAS